MASLLTATPVADILLVYRCFCLTRGGTRRSNISRKPHFRRQIPVSRPLADIHLVTPASMDRIHRKFY